MADPTKVLYHQFERYDEHGKKRPWPTIRLRALEKRPKPEREHPDLAWEPKRGKTRTKDERRTPLEILSRLAGSTTFKEPTVGRSTRGHSITNEDIAAALGYVKDPLQQRLALALACQTDAEWPAIRRLASAKLVRQLLGSHATRSLVAGKLRYRASVVLHEAFHDLALLRDPRPTPEGAQRLDMPPRDYRKLYRVVAGFIETLAQEGARTAVDALYNEG
jgi:hypothetical protein